MVRFVAILALASGLAVVPYGTLLAATEPTVPVAPDPSAWVRRLPPAPSYQRRVAVVIGFAGAGNNWQVAPPQIAEGARRSCLQVAAAEDMAWVDTLNRAHWRKHGLPDRLRALFLGQGIDLLVSLSPSSGATSLFRLAADGSTTLLAKSATPTSTSGESSLGTALRALLGYDAVVLAQEGDYVLVRSPEISPSGELFHAVAIEGSAPQDVLSGLALTPVAFLRFIRSSGPYAVWRVVSTKLSGDLPPATKLVFEGERPKDQ